MSGRFLFDTYASLFARKRFYSLNRALFHASIRGLGLLNDRSEGVSGELHFLKDYLSSIEKPTVVDVGANEGTYITSVFAVNNAVQAFAFEPHPAAYKRLLSHTSEIKSVTAVNAACGSEPGQVVLYDYANSAGSVHASLHRGVIEEIHHGQADQHIVDVIDLDTFSTSHNISIIHLLKIDTEGHEFEVLKGAVNLLRENRIRAIQFEFNEMNVISRVFFKDFCELMPQYRFYRTLRDGLVALDPYSSLTCELFAFQNIIALLRI